MTVGRTRAPQARTPIVALATPPGTSALAVVRGSGDGILALFGGLAARWPQPFPPRRPVLVSLLEEDGSLLDRGLLTHFPTPTSYTGEDVVEYSGHGNPRIIARLLGRLVARGARPAAPGEFTLRAYLNGRIDLVEAEGVRAIVTARTGLEARLAAELLDGRCGATLAALRDRIRSILAGIEAEIDFGDSDGVEPGGGRKADLRAVLEECRRQQRSNRRYESLERGATIALVGPPNAGKSTLFNRLVEEDLALVSEIPGTTRDSIRQGVDWRGRWIEFVDSAGLGDSRDPLDRLAAERSRREDQRADLRLAVVGPDGGAVAARIAAGQAILAGRPGLIVLSQCDEGLVAPPAPDVVAVSAVTGWGWSALVDAIERLVDGDGDGEAVRAALPRHGRQRWVRVIEELESALAGLGLGVEVAADGLRRAIEAIDGIRGEAADEALLGEIFGGFCIGK